MAGGAVCGPLFCLLSALRLPVLLQLTRLRLYTLPLLRAEHYTASDLEHEYGQKDDQNDDIDDGYDPGGHHQGAEEEVHRGLTPAEIHQIELDLQTLDAQFEAD